MFKLLEGIQLVVFIQGSERALGWTAPSSQAKNTRICLLCPPQIFSFHQWRVLCCVEHVDPYLQGQIACANVLSDMYAMGVADVDNVLLVLAQPMQVLMLLASSTDMKEGDREVCTKLMIRGFNGTDLK